MVLKMINTDEEVEIISKVGKFIKVRNKQGHEFLVKGHDLKSVEPQEKR